MHPLAGVTVSTLAGSSTAGGADGPGATATFNNPVGIVLDAAGTTAYVTEYDGGRVRIVAADGTTRTLTSSKANFQQPFGLAVADPSYLLVQTDTSDSGQKNADSGTLWRISLGTGDPAVLARGLERPRGLATLDPGSVVVADRTAATLSLLDPSAGTLRPLAGASGQAGMANGQGAGARFNQPLGVAVMPDGSIIVADSGNHCLRQVLRDGTVSTFAGDGTAGMVDGPKLSARFDRPIALAIDGAGVVYVSDQGANHRIRRVNLAGEVETVAGDGTAGFADGAGPQAEFYGQEGLAIAAGGALLYATDGNRGDGSGYHRVRKIVLPSSAR